MDTKSLDAIKDQLQEQQTKISAKADSLQAELAGLHDDRGRIEAALAALSGVALPSMNGKKREKKKVSAPSASKAQVVALMAEELSQHHAIEEELKARIEKKLVDTGHARLGYSLRFKEAVADSQFFKAPDGIRLKTESTGSSLRKSLTIGTSTSNGTGSSSSGHTTSQTNSTNQNS